MAMAVNLSWEWTGTVNFLQGARQTFCLHLDLCASLCLNLDAGPTPFFNNFFFRVPRYRNCVAVRPEDGRLTPPPTPKDPSAIIWPPRGDIGGCTAPSTSMSLYDWTKRHFAATLALDPRCTALLQTHIEIRPLGRFRAQQCEGPRLGPSLRLRCALETATRPALLNCGDWVRLPIRGVPYQL